MKPRCSGGARASSMVALACVSLVAGFFLAACGRDSPATGGESGLNGDREEARPSTRVAPEDSALVVRARAHDRAGQLDSARLLYQEAAGRLPPISDWLHLRAAGVTRDPNERTRYYALLETPVARDRQRPTEAIALERSGNIAAAIAKYAEAGNSVAALRLRLTRLADSAQIRDARRALLAYLGTRPGREPVREAIAVFDNVVKSPTAAEHLAIARAAGEAGLASRAVTSYTAAFKAGLGGSADRFRHASMLARLRRHADAAAAFARVTAPAPLAAAAAYQRARSQISLGQRAAARATLRRITTAYSNDTSAASALLLLGDLATDEGRDEAARTAIISVATRFPTAPHAATALFRAGIIAYVLGQHRTAATELDSLLARYPQSSLAIGAGYWSGRAWQRLGDTARAGQRWRAVVTREPLSYYTVLSSERLGVALLRDRSRADDYPVLRDISEAMKRVGILKLVGMDTEAGFEYDRLFSLAPESPERLVATAHALTGTDQSSRSMALGMRAVREIGATAQNLRLMYPVLERETLIRSSRAHGLDPALVAALIRQESSFNPRATSPVGARGLMQLMPSVGQSIARSQRVSDFTVDRLYEPALNIRLGTAHMAALFRRRSDEVHVLAGYNAGDSRVVRWLDRTGAGDPELFTERIPFTETRDYVKIVLRNRAFYRELYDW